MKLQHAAFVILGHYIALASNFCASVPYILCAAVALWLLHFYVRRHSIAPRRVRGAQSNRS